MPYLDKFFYLSVAGKTARAIDIMSGDPLVKRYAEHIDENGLPFLVIETHVGSKVIAEAVVGMTTGDYVEGKMVALIQSFVGSEPSLGDYM